MSEKELQLKTYSSMAKISHTKINGKPSKSGIAFGGTEFSFQVAHRITPRKYAQLDYDIKITSSLSEYIKLYNVDFVPAMLPVYPERTDKQYITTAPDIFPDPLFPVEDGKVCSAMGNWRSLWVSCNIPADLESGEYPVTVSFVRKGKTVERTTYKIKVAPVALPKSELIYTQWFHCDCIADIHKVPVFSEAHWILIEKYMKLAAEHGMNMILTPVVTPPLDTEIGAERPTVQLVGVTKTDSGYSFDFSLLERFVEMARSCGITRFEISHLFTQWGAYFAPKVVAKVGTRTKKIFGWNTSATSKEYAEFLGALVPELINFFVSIGVDKKDLYFHVSDEPRENHLESYKAAADILCPLIEGCNHMDALSAFDFYQKGLVSKPVVATNHITPYLNANIDGLWCYYCCSQCIDVSNRFLAMTSPRTRMIGIQMYKYGIEGFLQWGYNFYYTQLSKALIDPYKVTDGGEAFPAGDPFTVYPYKDGPIPSLRQKVFMQAICDITLLKLVEAKIGKEKVVAELDAIMGKPITFDTCANEESFFVKIEEMALRYLG